MIMQLNDSKELNGFTIVELLVVIVVIGILAAITVVSYVGITKKANAAVLQSDLSNSVSKLKMFYAENGIYPTANNCPNPGLNEICLKPSGDNTFQYSVSNNLTPPTFRLTTTNGSQSYTIGGNGAITVAGQNLLTGDTSIEKTGLNEFVQYADLASIVDNYGLVQYTISFDVKSADITTKNTAQVYMQNGAGARYGFQVNFPVTTSYVRQTATFTPVATNLSMAQSMLAFYGTYGTGNILSVKNVKVELGNVATPWAQAP